MNTMKGISSLFLALQLCHICTGAKMHTISTYDAHPKYIKGKPGLPLECSTGKKGAIEFAVFSPGLGDRLDEVSFRTASGHYLYEYKNELFLVSFTKSTRFSESATFTKYSDHFYHGTTTYKSTTTDRFLQCHGGMLVMGQVRSVDDVDRSSFIVKEVVPVDDGWTECSKSCGGGYKTPKKRNCLGFVCSEVAPRKCNTQPCDEPDICNPNPCQNDGECSFIGNSIKCKCKPGYSGYFCNVANPCKPNPCNSGKCSRTLRGYQCDCPQGLTGTNCELLIDYCTPNPCLHGGSCKSIGLDFHCICKKGYTGRTCDIVKDPCNPDPCNSGICGTAGTDYKCICLRGFTGKNCDIPPNKCLPNPCRNSGTCVRLASGGYKCQCKSGYSGTNCETGSGNTGSCTRQTCRNKGVCTNTANGYSCKCAIGYFGQRCGGKLKVGEWSPCSQTCGGTRYKIKKCSESNILDCPREYAECNTDSCTTVNCVAGSEFRFGTKSQCCRKTSGSTCGNPYVDGAAIRVIGGDVSEFMQWPWTVALFVKDFDEYYTCAGGLINSQWVVTAGHCTEGLKASELRVLLGSNVLSKPDIGHKFIDVRKIVNHPTYKNPVDDISLLKMKREVTFSDDIKPICMPKGEVLEEDVICYAAGWGVAFKRDLLTRKNSDVLRHVGLRTLPLDVCKQAYARDPYLKGVTDNAICSGILSGGKDTCIGDSGAPLVCQRKDSCDWYIAGVTSFGATECAVGNIPGGFIKVRNYETWINHVIKLG